MSRRLGLLIVLTLSGCDLPGRPDPASRPVPPDQVRSFTALYSTHCAGCHGADGKLGPAPPLNDPLFRAGIPRDELERVIRAGRPGTPMPAFGRSLTEEQIAVLVNNIQGPDAWGAPPPVPKNAPAYLHDPKDVGDLDRGKQIFARACADCHGASGEGGSNGAIRDQAFLALISDQALRRLIITGRPDLGMPNYADSTGRDDSFQPLSDQDISDLVALLKRWRDDGSPR